MLLLIFFHHFFSISFWPPYSNEMLHFSYLVLIFFTSFLFSFSILFCLFTFFSFCAFLFLLFFFLVVTPNTKIGCAGAERFQCRRSRRLRPSLATPRGDRVGLRPSRGLERGTPSRISPPPLDAGPGGWPRYGLLGSRERQNRRRYPQ